LFSVNIINNTIKYIYSFPGLGTGGYPLSYYGLYYKSGILYYTVANESMTGCYLYSLDTQISPKPSLIRQFGGYATIRAVLANNDSLNTFYVVLVDHLYKLPAGLAFNLIPEQTLTPLTENFVVAGIIDYPNRIIYSYDGLRWLVSPTVNLFSYIFKSAAFNGTMWVAGGDNDGDGANPTTLAYSSDGINWTASASGTALITGKVNAVAWTGTVWLAGGTGTNSLAYSYDGINWVAGQSIGMQVYSFYCTENFVIAGNGGTGFCVSYDGISWITPAVASDFFDAAGGWPNSIAGNSSIIVAGASGSSSLSWSYDGFNWNNSASGTALLGTVFSVAYNGSLWVAAGTGSNFLAYSSDGMTWTASESGNALFSGDEAFTVNWNGRVWLAGGLGPTGSRMAYSYDGIHWLRQQSANGLLTGEI
jgi:hypothetical protein